MPSYSLASVHAPAPADDWPPLVLTSAVPLLSAGHRIAKQTGAQRLVCREPSTGEMKDHRNFCPRALVDARTQPPRMGSARPALWSNFVLAVSAPGADTLRRGYWIQPASGFLDVTLANQRTESAAMHGAPDQSLCCHLCEDNVCLAATALHTHLNWVQASSASHLISPSCRSLSWTRRPVIPWHRQYGPLTQARASCMARLVPFSSADRLPALGLH